MSPATEPSDSPRPSADRRRRPVSGSAGFAISRLSLWQRLGALVVVIGVVSVFAVAVRLTPDERGFGTHEQLGLPPCQFRTLTGWNCPHCGMTTSFAFLVRGRWVRAVEANVAAVPLAAVAVIAGVSAATAVISGRWFGPADPMQWVIVGLVLYLGLTLLLWAARLALAQF